SSSLSTVSESPSARIWPLPSLPTRRSSDLLRLRDGFAAALEQLAREPPQVVVVCFDALDERRLGIDDALALLRLDAASSRATDRSEEHTSELQSRQKLGCRLLLEKKKG